MKWMKAAIIGILAGAFMFSAIAILTHIGFAPINVAPSATFLISIGLPPMPWAPIVHFGYATLGALIFLAIFKERVDIPRGIGWAMILWLIFMLIYSPIIGWGFFGAGGDAHQLPPQNPLFIGSAGAYVLMTLLLHVAYGAILGWLTHDCIDFEHRKVVE